MSEEGDDRTVVSSTKPKLQPVSVKAGVLEMVKGPGAPARFVLQKPSMLIGRDPAADISVPSGELSRKHCRLMKVGEEHMFVDLDSVNGVHLNGVKVHSAVLREGDRLQLGDVDFVFHERA